MQHVANFFDRTEWKVVLDVHISGVQLVSQVQSRIIESVAHLASLIDAFVQALLTRRLLSNFHAGSSDESNLFLDTFHAELLLIEISFTFNHCVLHVKHLCVESIYPVLELG